MQRQEVREKNQMSVLLTYSVRRVHRGLFIALSTAAALILPAHAQDFGEHSHKPPQFPVENHPRVSEKDYKAALEKIPTPAQKYDPWGVTHANEPQKAGAATAKNSKKTSPTD